MAESDADFESIQEFLSEYLLFRVVFDKATVSLITILEKGELRLVYAMAKPDFEHIFNFRGLPGAFVSLLSSD